MSEDSNSTNNYTNPSSNPSSLLSTNLNQEYDHKQYDLFPEPLGFAPGHLQVLHEWDKDFDDAIGATIGDRNKNTQR